MIQEEIEGRLEEPDGRPHVIVHLEEDIGAALFGYLHQPIPSHRRRNLGNRHVKNIQDARVILGHDSGLDEEIPHLGPVPPRGYRPPNHDQVLRQFRASQKGPRQVS